MKQTKIILRIISFLSILCILYINVTSFSFSLEYIPMFICSLIGIYWLSEGLYINEN